MTYSSSQLTVCFVITATLILHARGKSFQFAPYFSKEPSSIIAQKNRPLLLDCKVEGNPKPTIKWRHNGVMITPNVRRSILPDGSLYFKSINHTKGNRPDEGLYQCTASSQIGSQSYQIVSRTIKLQVAGLTSKIVIQPNSLEVFYGDMARLFCYVRHSIPNANISWTFKGKDGTTAPIKPSRKHTMLSFGVLQIGNVQSSDEGEYSCSAHNSLAQRSHTSGFIALTLKTGSARKPVFIGKPFDTNTTRGSRVMLECAVTGNPTPKVQWYKDSRPISYNDRVKPYGVNNLLINNASTSDDGVYICKISSGSLSKSATAILLVHYPPSFTTKLKNTNAHANSDVTFRCIASGNPSPSISWLKNGLAMTESDYINITSNSMKVMSILTLDTGIYQCVAKNYLAEIQSSAELAVFDQNIPLPTQEHSTTQPSLPTTSSPPTKQTTMIIPSTKQVQTSTVRKVVSVTGKPQNVKCYTRSETEIELTWEPPAIAPVKILQYNIFITNSKSGTQNDMKSTNSDVHKIKLQNLKKDTKYTFMVFAKTKDGAGMISQRTICWTASKSRPGVPLSLAAVGTSSSQIKVQWSQPTTGTTVKEYIIEYAESGKDVNITRATVTSRKHKTLKNLKTHTKYKIWVFSVDTAQSRSHPAETAATTLGGVPKGKPLDVRVMGDSSGTALIVTWKPPKFDLNAGITRYLLEYRKPGQKITPVDVKGDVLKHKLKRLDRDAVYEVRIAAGSSSGYGDFSQWTRANTSITKCSEDQIPGPPTDLELSTPGHGFAQIKVTWQPPVDVSQWCVTGYRLEYGEGAPVSPKISINASTRMYLIQEGIRSGREYVVKLEAINSKSNNGQNVQKTIKVPAVVPDKRKPIKQVQVIPLSSQEVKVSWVETSQQTPYLYHVFWLFKKTLVYCGNTTKLSIKCSGLQPYTYYTFIVRRFDEITNATASNKTLEATPNPPLDVTGRLAEDNSTDIVLSWQPPEKVNGKIMKYRIYYTTNASLPNGQWKRHEVKGNSLNTRITNLEQGVKYYFKIKVLNGAGWSGFSKTKMVTTYDPTKEKGDNDGSRGNTNAQAGGPGGLKDKTLWIVIAAVAGVTLIAIIVISVVLCKKRSGDDASPLRKPPPTYKAAVMTNGSSKKKHKEEKRPDLWINHSDQVEMKPLFKAKTNTTNIPRNSMDMKPLDDHPIDKIKVDHERSSFRKGSQDQELLPPPPPQLLNQEDDDDVDVPSPIAVPSYSPYRPVVSYPRSVAPDDGTAQLSYPDYPITSTPKHTNTVPRHEPHDHSYEPNHRTPLLRSHSDDIDHTPSSKPPVPIYAVPNTKNKTRSPKDEPRYQAPPPLPKPISSDPPPVGYSIPNGRQNTKDAVADLDDRLAGLEGLMKDLNEITSSKEYLT